MALAISAALISKHQQVHGWPGINNVNENRKHGNRKKWHQLMAALSVISLAMY
jgi:hypothetical protein